MLLSRGSTLKCSNLRGSWAIRAPAMKDEKSAWQPERPSRLPAWGKSSIAQPVGKRKADGERPVRRTGAPHLSPLLRGVLAGVRGGMQLFARAGGSGHGRGQGGQFFDGGQGAQFAAEGHVGQVFTQAELHQLPAHELARGERLAGGGVEAA